MKKLVLILSFLLIGCGEIKKTHTPIPAPYNVYTGKHIIISQDTYDSDNFSLIDIAQTMGELGIVHLMAVDVTGRDVDGKAGKLFSILTDAPIFINQSQTPTRVTPSSAPYPDIDQFPNDGLLDSQRPDSTLGLAEVLRGLPDNQKAVYVVGGHLNNLADLLVEYPDLVREKISVVVISSGWNRRGKAEMNLSEGLSKPTSTSAATQTVFNHLPKEVKLVMVSDPDADYPKIPVSWITNEALKYLVTHGHYYKNDGYFYMGDFEALAYAVSGTNWHGNVWAREVKTCVKVNSYGGAYITGGDCNHYYLDDVRSDILKAIFKEFL